jgi:membrane-associated phospholipid phosphatase
MTTTRRETSKEVGLLGAGLACYLAVRWYTLGSTDEAVANASDVLRLERALGLDWEHAIQDATMSVPGLSPFLTLVYVWGYLPALVGIALWIRARRRESWPTLRNALLASGAVGLVVYALYPCAPPWIGAGDAFTDTVAEGSFVDVARPPGVTNHLGAIPSFHVGWVVVVAYVALRVTTSRVLKVLCVLYPALMAWAVVSTGNHWVLDVPAGVALAAVGLLVVADGGGHGEVTVPEGTVRQQGGPGTPLRPPRAAILRGATGQGAEHGPEPHHEPVPRDGRRLHPGGGPRPGPQERPRRAPRAQRGRRRPGPRPG